jgi:hypothetical protein
MHYTNCISITLDINMASRLCHLISVNATVILMLNVMVNSYVMVNAMLILMVNSLLLVRLQRVFNIVTL